MAKVRVVFNKKATERVKQRIAEAVSKSNVEEIIADDLKQSVREGINPKTGRPYRRLKQSTIDQRRRLSKTNPTHSKYSPSKSNLTFTGQLVDSVFAKITALKTRINITIGVKGRHTGYKNLNGTRGKNVKNEVIAKGLADQNRPLVGISKKKLSEMANKIVKIVKANL